MKNTITQMALSVAAAMLAGGACATTLAWFHFDERDPGYAFDSSGPGVVTNACNAATPVYAYATTGNGTVGTTPAAYMPRYSTPAYSMHVYDPVSGRKWINGASMRFTTGTEAGKGGSYYGSTLKVPGTDKSFQPTDAITIECFVCTTGGVFNTFSPIFGKRNSGDYANESWALYMTANGKLEVRIKAKASGTGGQGVAINDGSWHHVAMTYDKTDGICRVYVDYEQRFTYAPSGGGAISYLDSQEESYTAFHIGGYPFASNNVGRKFNGCIDELRISDVALAPSQFLRFQVEDADEMVRISFDPHSFYGADMNTSVNYNSRPDLPAKFTATGGTVALDASEKFAATLRDGIFADATANNGSYSAATNGTGQSGYFKVSALTTSMSGGNVETNMDYTIEAFFKTRTTGKAYGPRTLFALGTWPVAGVVLNNKDNSGQLCFTYNDGKSWRGIYSAETTANDGNWHHVAIVHDVVRRQMRFYFDGKLSASTNNINNVLQTGSSLFVGSNTSGGNGFDGWIDDVRVMNRALSPDEFLTTHDVANVNASDPTVALMDFEGSYAVSPYPGLVGAGEGAKHSSEGVAPEFVGHTRKFVLDGVEGTDKVNGTRCMKLADSHAVWPYSPLFEQEAFTVEFFAKISDLVSGGSPVRYIGGTDDMSASPIWALYRDPSKDDLCLRIQLVKDGVSSGNYSAHWLSDAEIKDGHWHHYAFTLAPKDGTNTVVELFRDHASVGAHELPGRLDYSFGNGGRLSLGTGASGNKVYGSYDMLRFSKRVLAPDAFIRMETIGTTLILR